jgi:KipI family sensor histidine kinase inhibitor
MINVRILTVGDDALLLEFADGGTAESWRADLWQRRESGEFRAREIVAGARTVLLDGCDVAGLREQLPAWAPRHGAGWSVGSLVQIPIVYDGDDLDWVAGHLGRTAADFVEWHLATEFHVAFCGFAPGFAYMSGLDVTVPRLATPRPRVPAGAVGLADSYCGIYPSASPGGWRLIGRTTAVLFDPQRAAPALLSPGTRVRFSRTRP